jgi:hypothetical protein
VGNVECGLGVEQTVSTLTSEQRKAMEDQTRKSVERSVAVRQGLSELAGLDRLKLTCSEWRALEAVRKGWVRSRWMESFLTFGGSRNLRMWDYRMIGPLEDRYLVVKRWNRRGTKAKYLLSDRGKWVLGC